MKALDYATWIAFLVSFIISILTMLVVFGIVWDEWISPFATFLPLEISLSLTFFLWSINSLYNKYTKSSKYTFYYFLMLGGILIGFVVMGIY